MAARNAAGLDTSFYSSVSVGGHWPINFGVIATGNDRILIRCAEHHPRIPDTETLLNQ